ncbi:MAG: ORF6N domain-containing protein [Flavobacteriales bacterium]|nr:MAG: ORF6N domain-containing protein [Flavobacteriales bacterium]MBE7443275.1 ORF6N domain-containing protein [Flavobacteriales bacterium]MCL4856035.1 ORF6N domain-containing protein [Flavobacteriales bacterium]
MNAIIKFEHIENKIITLRGLQVILDSDVASLYGVQTKEINQAVKNNPDKFPKGYILVLTKAEKTELVKNFDRFNPLKHSSNAPKAFTEKGLYMLATILKSEQATQTTLSIIETFASLKNISRTINELSKTNNENKKQQLLKKSGEMIAEIFDNDLANNESETSIEINFAVLKFKHTIKKKKDS